MKVLLVHLDEQCLGNKTVKMASNNLHPSCSPGCESSLFFGINSIAGRLYSRFLIKKSRRPALLNLTRGDF